MDNKSLERLLKGVKQGKTSVDAALKKISKIGYEDIVFAKVDHHRKHRQGFCEVIYCPGKSVSEISLIAKKLLASSDTLLATRASADIYKALKKVSAKAKFHEKSGAVTVEKKKKRRQGKALVVTAGTSDIPVAEEAAVTADIMGCGVKTIYDVGVAGIHRLLDCMDEFKEADCIIVAAGMDGALASVVGGMVDIPIIAVPTSVGYGASFGGIAALLAMLNSCSTGIAVVNIDNGFGAGALARRIISLKYGK